MSHQSHVARPAVARQFDPADNGVVVCIAPGPSLTYTDLRTVQLLQEQARGRLLTITINDAYRPYPGANYRYAADGYWWAARTDAYARAMYPGSCYTLEHGAPPAVTKLDYNSAIDLSDDPTILATGGHSGYSGVNFAYHLGPKTIALLGYDMQPHPTSGDHHFGGDEPGQRHVRYHLWLPWYRKLGAALASRDVQIYNCTRHTAIPAGDIPRRHLDDLLGFD